MANQNTIRLIMFGVLGGTLGFFFSCLYLIVYYGAVYSQPVSDSFRSNNAFQIAMLVFISICVTFSIVYHRKTIAERLVRNESDAE